MKSTIERLERPANVSERVAKSELRKNFPKAKIVSFKRVGTMYVADLRVAEFPPPKVDDGMGGDDPLDLTGDDAGMDADLDIDGDGDPDLDGDADAEDKEDQIMDMLHKIMDHLGISDGDDEGDLDEEMDGLDLPDIGAPEAGEPMGGPPGGGDLPPPAPKPGGGGGMGAFSHTLQRKVGSRRSFTAHRHDAGSISNRQIIDEAVAGFPGYRVARLNRKPDGSVLVAMVAKG